ncbi:MAG TPA: integrase arm-type DNA-binding domain-containing protein, partial [Pseudomonadales bacterium]
MADITLAQANALLKELRTEAATSNSKKSRGSTKDGKHALDLGLRIVANPSGTASFVYRAKINGKLKPIKLKDIGERITAADLEAARDAYRAARAEVIAGTDPAEKRRQAREAAAEEAAMVKAAQAEKAFTVRRLCDAYVEARSDEGSDNYRKSWRENQWYLETYLYPAIGDKPVSQVDVANCADILN